MNEPKKNGERMAKVVSLPMRRIRKRLFAGEIDDQTAAMLLALSHKPLR